MIRFGFEHKALNRIEAATIEDNHASRHLLERMDFVCEEIPREYSVEDDGRYHGSAMYDLLRRQYEGKAGTGVEVSTHLAGNTLHGGTT